MGGLLTLPSFVTTFPSIDTTKNDSAKTGTSHESTLQGVAIGIYESEFVAIPLSLWRALRD